MIPRDAFRSRSPRPWISLRFFFLPPWFSFDGRELKKKKKERKEGREERRYGTNMGESELERCCNSRSTRFDSFDGAYSKISNLKISTRIFPSPSALSSPNFFFFFFFSLSGYRLYFVHAQHPPSPRPPFFHSCKFHGIIEFSRGK